MKVAIIKWLHLICLFFLSGCSQKFSDTISTINESIDGYIDINLSTNEFINQPFDSMLVRLNDGKLILMVLALIEKAPNEKNARFKWVSKDNVMVVTINGRIIKTEGLENDNLINIGTYYDTPSLSINHSEWTTYYDWSPNYRYNFTAQITSEYIKKSTITLLDWSVETKHIKETIKFIELNTQIVNHYWLNSNNETVKSIQYLGPNMDKIEIKFIKKVISS